MSVADCSDRRPGAALLEARDACHAAYPELTPCTDYVWSWIESGFEQEVIADLGAWREAHPRDWTATFLSGWAQYMSDHPQGVAATRKSFEQALRLAAEREDHAGAVHSLMLLGAIAEISDNEIDVAGELYEQALHEAEAGTDDDLVVRSAWSLATVRRQQGRYATQTELLGRALDRLRAEGHDSLRRPMLYALGNAHRKLGDERKARRYFEEDLELALRDDDAYEETLALMMLGVMELDFSEPAQSIPWFERCARRAEAAELDAIRSHAEVLIGVAVLQSGRTEEARERLRASLPRAMESAEANPEWTTQGVVNLLFLAEAERRLGREQPARDLYFQARQRASLWNKPNFMWQASGGLAALYLTRGRLDDAIREARRGVDEIESLRSVLPDTSQRVYFLRQRSNVYVTLASALGKRDPEDMDAVFDVVERVHSRSLREVLNERLPGRVTTGSPTISDVQSGLANGDVLLEYLLGEEESLLISVTRSEARLYRLPPRQEIETAVERYREILQRPAQTADARIDPEGDFRRFGSTGRELHRTLLAPAQAEIAGAERLIVVPDKQLHRLPFGALPTADLLDGVPVRFLAESHATVYLPSASFLLEPGPDKASGVVIVSADRARPSLGLPALVEAATEVDEIRRSYAPDDVRALVGKSATRSNLERSLANPARTLHLLGHALLDPSAGPRIVLEGGTPGTYDLLSADDIAGLEPTPPLVVLSACETGEGELVGGEGILGMVRAFQLAGSSQIVASLWKADDAGAAALMGRFHRQLQNGHRPSAALARARREILEDGFVHPFPWSTFVLYGFD